MQKMIYCGDNYCDDNDDDNVAEPINLLKETEKSLKSLPLLSCHHRHHQYHHNHHHYHRCYQHHHLYQQHPYSRYTDNEVIVNLFPYCDL